MYSFSNAQNGRVLGFIGVLSSLLQGGLTRRSSRPPADFVTTGISACVMSMALLASLPYFGSSSIGSIGRSSSFVLYAASAGLAYVSAVSASFRRFGASLADLAIAERRERFEHPCISRVRQARGRFVQQDGRTIANDADERAGSDAGAASQRGPTRPSSRPARCDGSILDERTNDRLRYLRDRDGRR